MLRYLKIGLVLLLAVTATGTAFAQVFPSVAMSSFDPTSGSYTYTVTCPENSTYQFGYLQIDTQVANAVPTGPWQIQGPFVGGVNKLWPTGYMRWDYTNFMDSAIWDPFSRGVVIPANTAWQGQFILVIPNSQPVMGKAATRDGQAGSYKVHDLLVPGPKITPPPSTDPPTTTISLDGTLGDNDWYVSPVTVTLSAVDPDDDLNITEYQLDEAEWQGYAEPFAVTGDGEHVLLARSDDLEGNLEEPPASATFKVDATPPGVSAVIVNSPNVNGWYNSDVQISYSAADAVSGLASPQSAEPGVSIQFTRTVSAEGSDMSDTASATDNAGNTGSCTVNGLKIDKTAPSISVLSAPTGGCHLISYETAVIRFSATDSVSAVDGLPWASISVMPTEGWASPSAQTMAATKVSEGIYELSLPLSVPGAYTVVLYARDLAGNIAELSTPLTFGAGGFTVEWLPPISLMETYLMADGSTVPVKFRLIDPCNNNAYVNSYNYKLKVVNTVTLECMVELVPEPDFATGSYHVNVRTKDDNNVDWPLGDYTVVIEGPGIWDVMAGPYKSRYGLLLVDRAVAKGVGKR